MVRNRFVAVTDAVAVHVEEKDRGEVGVVVVVAVVVVLVAFILNFSKFLWYCWIFILSNYITVPPGGAVCVGDKCWGTFYKVGGKSKIVMHVYEK